MSHMHVIIQSIQVCMHISQDTYMLYTEVVWLVVHAPSDIYIYDKLKYW